MKSGVFVRGIDTFPLGPHIVTADEIRIQTPQWSCA
jgi:hypothetical protein